MEINAFDYEVVVCGAGPVGLFAALELTRFDVGPIYVFDSKYELSSYSKALTIHSRSLEILCHHHGMYEKLREKATFADGLQAMSNEQKELVHLNFPSLQLDTKHKYVMCVPQPQTEGVLYDILRRQYGREVHWGKELVGVTPSASGVTVSIQDLRSGDISTIRTKFLIACDGGKSFVRHAFKLSFDGYAVPATFLNVDTHLHINSKGPGKWGTHGIVWMQGLPFAVIPSGPDRYRIVGALGPDEQPERSSQGGIVPPTLETVQKLVDKHLPSYKVKAYDPIWLSYFESQERKINEAGWQPHPHVFLAGDAAHVHLPIGGWGMNTGFQDVSNLAWKLSLFLKFNTTPSLSSQQHLQQHRQQCDPSTSPLLSSYGQERNQIADRLISTTGGAGNAMLTNFWLLRWIRTVLIKLLLSLPYVKTIIARTAIMIDLHYKVSKLNFTPSYSYFTRLHFPSHIAPGSRAPDGEIRMAGQRDFSRLYDAIYLPSSSFIFLLFAGKTTIDDSQIINQIEMLNKQYGGSLFELHVVHSEGWKEERSFNSTPIEWIDVQSNLHKKYGVYLWKPTLVLIRPDRHVLGSVVLGYESQLFSHLQKILR